MSEYSEEKKVTDGEENSESEEPNLNIPTIQVTEVKTLQASQEQLSSATEAEVSENMVKSQELDVARKSESERRPSCDKNGLCNCKHARSNQSIGSGRCSNCPNCSSSRTSEPNKSKEKSSTRESLNAGTSPRVQSLAASENSKRNSQPPSFKRSSGTGKIGNGPHRESSPKARSSGVGSIHTLDSMHKISPSKSRNSVQGSNKGLSLTDAMKIDSPIVVEDEWSKRTSNIPNGMSSSKSSPRIEQRQSTQNDQPIQQSTNVRSSPKSSQQTVTPPRLSPKPSPMNSLRSIQSARSQPRSSGNQGHPQQNDQKRSSSSLLGSGKENNKQDLNLVKDSSFLSTPDSSVPSARKDCTPSIPESQQPQETSQILETSSRQGETLQVPEESKYTNEAPSTINNEQLENNKQNTVDNTVLNSYSSKPDAMQTLTLDTMKQFGFTPTHSAHSNEGKTDGLALEKDKKVPSSSTFDNINEPEAQKPKLEHELSANTLLSEDYPDVPHDSPTKKTEQNSKLIPDVVPKTSNVPDSAENIELTHDKIDPISTMLVEDGKYKQDEEFPDNDPMADSLPGSNPTPNQNYKQPQNANEDYFLTTPYRMSFSGQENQQKLCKPIRPFELSVAGFCDANEMGYFPLQEQIACLEKKLLQKALQFHELEDSYEALLRSHCVLEENIKNANFILRDQVVFENLKVNYQLVTAELEEARLLLREVRKLGWENLPQRMMQECKDVHEKLAAARKERDRAIHEESAARGIATEALKQVKLLSAAIETHRYFTDELEAQKEAEKIAHAKAVKKVYEDCEMKHFAQQARDRRRQTHLEKLIQDLTAQINKKLPGDLKEVIFHSNMGFRYPSLDECKVDALAIEGEQADGESPKQWHIISKLTPEALNILIDYVKSPTKAQDVTATTKARSEDTKKPYSPSPKPRLSKSGGGVLGDEGDENDQLAAIQNERIAWEQMRNQSDQILSEKEEEISKLRRKIQELENELGEAKKKQSIDATKESQLQTLQKENKLLSEQYQTQMVLRKKYHSQIEDLKGKVRVFCRIRPVLNNEMGKKQEVIVFNADPYSVMVKKPKGMRNFQYDRVFGSASTQKNVLHETKGLIQSAIDGYNVCILAYGQTGAGKSYTLVGDHRDPGLIPRAIDELFTRLEDPEFKEMFIYDVTFSMYNLCDDNVVDLMEKSSQIKSQVEITRDSKGMTCVPGLKTENATCATELQGHFQWALANRAIFVSKNNTSAAAWHLFTNIMIMTTNRITQTTYVGKLTFVDLIGSEKALKTNTSTEASKDVQHSNPSLSALGDVLFALQASQTPVPYRNSTLTTMLQDSLGGNGKTLLIAHLSPTDTNLNETLSTLNYATRIKTVTNEPTRLSNSEQVAKLRTTTERIRYGE